VGKTIQVLMVDDEAAFCESLSKILRRRGLEIVTAPNGVEALKLLLDLRMPILDGIATLERIRKRDDSTPVIVLTGAPELKKVSAAMNMGASEVLTKPCSIDTLISVIENAAERRRAALEVTSCGSDRNPPG
jgi:DNA-binding NtrC family response regulator